jgi:hypothetical protein
VDPAGLLPAEPGAPLEEPGVDPPPELELPDPDELPERVAALPGVRTDGVEADGTVPAGVLTEGVLTEGTVTDGT